MLGAPQVVLAGWPKASSSLLPQIELRLDQRGQTYTIAGMLIFSHGGGRRRELYKFAFSKYEKLGREMCTVQWKWRQRHFIFGGRRMWTGCGLMYGYSVWSRRKQKRDLWRSSLTIYAFLLIPGSLQLDQTLVEPGNAQGPSLSRCSLRRARCPSRL